MNIIHVCGFDQCPFFYQACIYASVLKKHDIVDEYTVKSFRTRVEFFTWLKTETDFVQHKTCPIVWKNEKEYIGGCDSLRDIMNVTLQEKKLKLTSS